MTVMGCADVLHLLCFFAMSGYVLNMVISYEKNKLKMPIFQKSRFF